MIWESQLSEVVLQGWEQLPKAGRLYYERICSGYKKLYFLISLSQLCVCVCMGGGGGGGSNPPIPILYSII